MDLRTLLEKLDSLKPMASEHASAISHVGLFFALSSGRDQRDGTVNSDCFNIEVVASAMVMLKEDSSRSIYDCLRQSYDLWSSAIR